MALNESELCELQYQLGFNLLGYGAYPYIQTVQIFRQIVNPYLLTGAITESSTPVTALVPQTPFPVTLTLVDATGFKAFDPVFVDTEDRQEFTTVSKVVGNTITVSLSKTHTGTYLVTVDSGEAKIREILKKIKDLTGFDGLFHQRISAAGIKQVDEIEFFPNGGYNGTKSSLQEIKDALMYYRDELSVITGVPNMWRYRNRGTRMELY